MALILWFYLFGLDCLKLMMCTSFSSLYKLHFVIDSLDRGLGNSVESLMLQVVLLKGFFWRFLVLLCLIAFFMEKKIHNKGLFDGRLYMVCAF